MVLFNAYFDETGTNRGDPALVLGGFYSTQERSEALALEWQALLDEWGIPFFHMTDFEADIGYYAGWKDTGLHEPRLDALIDLILKYVVAGVGVAVPRAEFRKVCGPKVRDHIRYSIAGRALFHEMSCLDRNGNVTDVYPAIGSDRFAYVFETGARGIGQVATVYRRLYNRPESRSFYRLGAFAYGGKQEYQPLQAADILAFEVRAQWERLHGFQELGRRYSYERLSAIPCHFKNVTAGAMENVKEDTLLAIKEGRI